MSSSCVLGSVDLGLVYGQFVVSFLCSLCIFIGDPISPYIVTIWKVVFANNSRTLGWIWMKLGRWG